MEDNFPILMFPRRTRPNDIEGGIMMECPHNRIQGDNYGRKCLDCGKYWEDHD